MKSNPVLSKTNLSLVSNVSKFPIAWDVFRIPNTLIIRTKKTHVAQIARNQGYRVIPVFGKG